MTWFGSASRFERNQLAASGLVRPDLASDLSQASSEMRAEVISPTPRDGVIRATGRRIVDALPEAITGAIVAGAPQFIRQMFDSGWQHFGGWN